MEKETKKEGRAAVPPHIAEASDAKKRAKRKTLAQLPVYRALANLKYLTVSMMIAAPRSTTKFFDQLLCTISEAKKAVGMADISRSAADRSWYIDCARVMVQDVCDDIQTLRYIEVPRKGEVVKVPLVSNDLFKKTKAVAKSIMAQLVAWRDYTNNEGVKSK